MQLVKTSRELLTLSNYRTLMLAYSHARVLSYPHTLIRRPLVHLLPPRRDARADHARPSVLGGAAQAALRDRTLALILTLTLT